MDYGCKTILRFCKVYDKESGRSMILYATLYMHVFFPKGLQQIIIESLCLTPKTGKKKKRVF